MESHFDIEDFYQDKLGKLELPFASGSFDAMLQRVQREKKKKRLIYFFSGAGLLSIFSLLLFVLTDTPAPPLAETNLSPREKMQEVLKPEKQTKSISKEQAVLWHPSKEIPVKAFVPSYIPEQDKASQPLAIAEFKEPGQSTSAEQNPGNTKTEQEKPDPVLPDVIPGKEKDPTLKENVVADPFTFLEPVPFTGLPEGLPALEPVLVQTKNYQLEKELLVREHGSPRADFFIGLSNSALLYTYRFSKNSASFDNYQIGYKSGFNAYYLENRRAEQKVGLQNIPGLRFGLVYKKQYELSSTFGFYKMSESEQIHLREEDTLTVTTPTSPLGSPGFPNGGLGSTRQAHSVDANDQANRTYKNTFQFIYGSLDLSKIFPLGSFKLKPGISLAFSHLYKASYLLIDSLGYTYQDHDFKHLQRNQFSVLLKAGISKTLWSRFDLQLSPVFMLSPTSLFDDSYFIRQKFSGFGLEACLIFRIPHRLPHS